MELGHLRYLVAVAGAHRVSRGELAAFTRRDRPRKAFERVAPPVPRPRGETGEAAG